MFKDISHTNWLHIIFVVSLIIMIIIDLDTLTTLVVLINMVNILLFINTIIYSNIKRKNLYYKKLYELQNQRLRKDNINKIIKKI